MRFLTARFAPRWTLAACAAAVVGGASIVPGPTREATAQDAPDRPKLPAEMERIARVVKPRADETRWSRIPWLTDLAQARQVALQEHRPLFLFVSGDDPLEAC